MFNESSPSSKEMGLTEKDMRTEENLEGTREDAKDLIENRWKEEVLRLKKEYEAIRERMPLKGVPLDDIWRAIDVDGRKHPHEVFSKFLSVVGEVRSSSEFSELREIGFDIFATKATDQGSDTFLSPPFITRRGKAPIGYKGRERGSFNPNNGIITVWQDRIRQLSSWGNALKEAARGSLTEEDEVVFHETVHASQMTDLDSVPKEGIKKKSDVQATQFREKYRDSKIYRGLAEAQAFMSSSFFYPVGSGKEAGNPIVETLVSGYGVPRQEAEYSIKVIKDMKALGLGDKEIAEIIRSEEIDWDEREGVSPSIEKAIRKLRIAKGIPEDADLSLAYEIHCWQRKITRARLMEITRTELAKLPYFLEEREDRSDIALPSE